MPEFDVLGPLAKGLHQEFVTIYYLLLPVFFALAVTTQWFKAGRGTTDFLDILKRAIISTLLLVALPDISNAILFIVEGICERIDTVNSLDNIVRMAQEKSKEYSLSTSSILLQFNTLLIAILSFLSYLIVYVARYIMIAMYYFYWIFFMISAPLLLLFNLFSSTSQVTANLFKGMIEVASWKIVWAILGAMLSALSFGDIYQVEGNYITLIVMNFVIAIAMLLTPLLVKSLVGAGAQSASSTLGSMAFGAMVAAPAKVAAVATTSRSTIQTSHQFLKAKATSARQAFAKKPLRSANDYINYPQKK